MFSQMLEFFKTHKKECAIAATVFVVVVVLVLFGKKTTNQKGAPA